MSPFRDHAAKLRYDASKVKVICEGNSLVFGYGATNQATMSFPKQLQRLPLLSAAGITVTNLGVGGSTFKDNISMTARAGAVDALYEAGKSHVLLIWEGTNTIWNNAAYSGADAGQQCWDYVTARRAAMPGVKIVLLTTLPRYAGQNAQYGNDLITPNNKLIAYDNFLKAHWRDMGAAGIVDVRASGVFKESGTNAQPVAWRPYNTDLVHLNDAGYGLIAQYCEPVLRHLMAR